MEWKTNVCDWSLNNSANALGWFIILKAKILFGQNIVSRIYTYISYMYQLCISYTSGDTVVFMKVFFLIFSLFRQIVRHYNSSTIGHRDFRFETLNRLCNNLPHANIYFYVLRTKTVKRPKNCQHILNYKSRTTRRRDFWFEMLIGLNTV